MDPRSASDLGEHSTVLIAPYPYPQHGYERQNRILGCWNVRRNAVLLSRDAKTFQSEFRVDFQEFLRKLGGTIRAHRRAIGLTQEDLGAKLNVSTQWISEMERGNGAPSLELLYNVSEFMGTSISELTRVVAGASNDDDSLREVLVALERQPAEVLKAAAELASALSRAGRPADDAG